MKRTIVFLVVLVFTFMFFPPVEATIFKKGDKVIDKRTGDVYEFQYKADIGIYSADSGLGDLFIINGKVYAITPQGVVGMKAVSERTDTQAELNTALKRYRSKKAEAARAWKALADEKAKRSPVKLWNYDDSEWHYRHLIERLEDLELRRAKKRLTEMEQWSNLAQTVMLESKDALATVRGFLEAKEKKVHLLNIYMAMLFCMIPIAFGAGSYYRVYTSRKTVEPAEEMEITDLTDLA